MGQIWPATWYCTVLESTMVFTFLKCCIANISQFFPNILNFFQILKYFLSGPLRKICQPCSTLKGQITHLAFQQCLLKGICRANLKTLVIKKKENVYKCVFDNMTDLVLSCWYDSKSWCQILFHLVNKQTKTNKPKKPKKQNKKTPR